MATFAVIAEHPPQLCPTSNAQTRQILKEGASQIPKLAEQLGVNIGTLRIFGPDHIILAVVEADDIDSVRNFALQSRLMQWNTVKIHATYSIEEAVGMIDEVEAIFYVAADRPTGDAAEWPGRRQAGARLALDTNPRRSARWRRHGTSCARDEARSQCGASGGVRGLQRFKREALPSEAKQARGRRSAVLSQGTRRGRLSACRARARSRIASARDGLRSPRPRKAANSTFLATTEPKVRGSNPLGRA